MPQAIGEASPVGKKITPVLQCSDVMLRHG
jgi:hypothetical protein